jgi:hypothetical protein
MRSKIIHDILFDRTHSFFQLFESAFRYRYLRMMGTVRPMKPMRMDLYNRGGGWHRPLLWLSTFFFCHIIPPHSIALDPIIF